MLEGNMGEFKVPALKALDFTQAAAVQNTWYTAFEGDNIEFSLLGMGVTVADETLEMQITIDGVVFTSFGIALTFAANMVSGCQGFRTNGLTINILMMAAASAALFNTYSDNYSGAIKGRSVKIKVRKTTAGGASALRVLGNYWQW